MTTELRQDAIPWGNHQAQAIADRTLPHDLEAERAILGVALLDADAWPAIAAAVTAADFYRDAHRKIFATMATLAERGTAIDLIPLRDLLATTGELDEVGGPAYISALVDGLPRASNVAAYAAITREKARLRGLIFAGNKIVAAAYEQDPAAEIVDAGTQALIGLAETAGREAVPAVEAAMAYVDRLDGVKDGAMATGFTDLDEQLAGGLRTRTLTILAGRPGAGKSSLGLGLALGIARKAVPAAYFSAEMQAEELGGRLVSWGARVDQHRMVSGFIGERDYGRITLAVAELVDVPLVIQDSAASLVEIAAWCQRLRAERGIRVAVVDYLQLLLPERRSKSREEDVAGLARGLKRLAKQQDLAVVALSALNRAPEGRRDNRPRLADLRESGAIEYDADTALLLFRQDQYEKTEEARGVAEVIVAKSRTGPTGVVKLVFLEEFGGMFANMACL